MRAKKVNIDWSYPRTYENIFYSPQIYDIGLHYLSRKYGNNETLLYIGKTSNSFYNRLNSHKYWLNLYRGKLFVRLGIIISPKTYDDSLITDVESALIYEMQPFENTDKTNGYYYLNECKIVNTGYRGLLPPVISMWEHI
ncbi:MAG TPA: hypothetical protein VFC96_04750 [Anaerovoracaceae bacterium]|nr:hypothetical protein [Anaerovoracaceae bacterium]